ncbi:MAG: NTP transferase domain-containing protein [Bacteroidales bacterium]|nr:NTP transferase domain-containing protein [Bacteroidales bacterium]
MIKRAIILAGGKGTRLKPYTISLPKPLVPIVDKPIIEIIIQQLVKNGFNHITLTINHMAEIIKAFCGDGSKWGVKIDYSHEEMPLSTMGPLTLIKDLPDNFLVMNGDVLTDLNFAEFYDYHVKSKNIFTIASFKREHVNNYGVLEVGVCGSLSGFFEKPVHKFEVSMGVYMVNKEILNFIPENTSYGFDNLMEDLLFAKRTVNVRTHSSYWLDIGRPDDYEQAFLDYDEILKYQV